LGEECLKEYSDVGVDSVIKLVTLDGLNYFSYMKKCNGSRCL
jgi:hypothetical protein